MYAIVETSGRQYRCEPGATISVDRIDGEVGAEITLDRVLMIGGDTVTVGTPTVAGATVTAKIVEHPLGDKVITFKYKPRKRSRRRVGSRARNTTLEIVDIKA